MRSRKGSRKGDILFCVMPAAILATFSACREPHEPLSEDYVTTFESGERPRGGVPKAGGPCFWRTVTRFSSCLPMPESGTRCEFSAGACCRIAGPLDAKRRGPMPRHLVLKPYEDGDLGRWMQWLSHARHVTQGLDRDRQSAAARGGRKAVRHGVQRGTPFGGERRTAATAARLSLESTLRSRGRPRKHSPNSHAPSSPPRRLLPGEAIESRASTKTRPAEKSGRA